MMFLESLPRMAGWAAACAIDISVAFSVRAKLLALWIAVFATQACAQFSTFSAGGATPTGAFSYSIPIRIPPGTAGVAPQLALTYNSQSGNGIAGVGWNLSGLSVISRCPKTQAIDGVRGGVNLDSNDRYCLDGQRLVAVSGAYDQAGTRYYTELFNGARITQLISGALTDNRATTQPVTCSAGRVCALSAGRGGEGVPLTTTFKVETKAGEVMEYISSDIVDTTNSTIVKSRMFLLSLVTDARGNNWSVTYSHNSSAGEFLPTTIAYTANYSVTPSLAPYNKIRMEYEARPTGDTSLAFIGGAKVSNSQRLKTIRTEVAGADGIFNTVTTYRLGYDTSASTGRSRLTTVQQCDATGACLGTLGTTPIRFAYSGTGRSGFFGEGAGDWPATGANVSGVNPGDYNGDALTDLVAYDTGINKWHVCNSTGAGFSCTHKATPGLSIDPEKTVTGDFDGDGRTDLALFSKKKPIASPYFCQLTPTGAGCPADPNLAQYDKWHVCFSRGGVDFTCTNNVSLGGQIEHEHVTVADINGDGRSDLISISSGESWGICLSSSGVGASFSCGQRRAVGRSTSTVFGDLNGDGLTDILAYTGSGALWFSCLSTGGLSDFSCAHVSAHGLGVENNISGDFNGDGKLDIAGFASNGSYWHVCLSTGGKTDFSCAYVNALGTRPPNAYAGDFNGDGRTDMQRYISANTWEVCISTGGATHFDCYTTAAHGGPAHNNIVGDFNGDGLSDMAGHAGGPNWAIRTASAAFPDLITGATSDLGLQTNISYMSLTKAGSAGRYVKSFVGAPYSTGYPYLLMAGPLRVVTSIFEDNGAGGQNALDYFYWSGVTHLAGRDFLGFSKIESLSSATRIISRTQHHLDWPLTGIPAEVQTILEGPPQITLSQSLPAMSSRRPEGSIGAGSTCAGGAPCLVYTSQVVEKSTDLDGTKMPWKRTTSLVDGYGNPTDINSETLDSAGAATGYGKRTLNTYDNIVDSSRWQLSRLRRAQVTSTTP